MRSFLADTGTHVFFLLCAPWLPHLQSGTHSHRSCLHGGCEGLRERIAELEKLYVSLAGERAHPETVFCWLGAR